MTASHNVECAKRLRFPKGVKVINFPFLLHDLSPWQEQVATELERTQKRVGTNKSSRWGYRIENGDADIYVEKVWRR